MLTLDSFLRPVCLRSVLLFFFHRLPAADGFWNNVSAAEIAAVIGKELLAVPESDPISRTSSSVEKIIAEALLHKCIANAARMCSISVRALNKMEASQSRRDIIDDVTILVILIKDSLLCPS